MTKTTYKVGDKVRITGDSVFGVDNIGKDAKITKINIKLYNGGHGHSVLLIDDDGKEYLYREKNIEKVEESDAKMTQFKVGDKVEVSKEHFYYDIGDTFVINKIDGVGDLFSAEGICVFPRKVNLASPKPTKKQRLTTLEQKVEAMQAEIDSLKAAQKITVSAPNFTIKSEADIAKIASELAEMVAKEMKLTPNEQRKAIIDEAKAFVEDVSHRMAQYGHGNLLGKHGEITTNVRGYVTKVEFVVNAEKRTVVAIVRNLHGHFIREKAIAKCAPNDVFNADIGKAIALGRALGLDVSKFEKAVQPSEVVEGMVVIHTEDEDVYTIEGVYEGNRYDMRHTVGDYFEKFPMTDGIENFYDIVNDTEAQY